MYVLTAAQIRHFTIVARKIDRFQGAFSFVIVIDHANLQSNLLNYILFVLGDEFIRFTFIGRGSFPIDIPITTVCMAGNKTTNRTRLEIPII